MYTQNIRKPPENLFENNSSTLSLNSPVKNTGDNTTTEEISTILKSDFTTSAALLKVKQNASVEKAIEIFRPNLINKEKKIAEFNTNLEYKASAPIYT